VSDTPCPLVVGVFDDPAHAREAVGELTRAGFGEGDVGVIGRETEDTAEPTGKSKAGEFAAAGAAAGAGVGALWALGIACGMLPALGPAFAGGILASLLTSAATTATFSSLVAALVGLGLPEEEAHRYEGEVKFGRTLVTVVAGGRSDEAGAILQRHGGRVECNAAVGRS
jgi:hypothetical protein